MFYSNANTMRNNMRKVLQMFYKYSPNDVASTVSSLLFTDAGFMHWYHCLGLQLIITKWRWWEMTNRRPGISKKCQMLTALTGDWTGDWTGADSGHYWQSEQCMWVSERHCTRSELLWSCTSFPNTDPNYTKIITSSRSKLLLYVTFRLSWSVTL